MHRVFYRTIGLTLAASSLLAVGCANSETDEGQLDTAAQATATDTAASGSADGALAPAAADMRIEVDLNARQLYVIRGGERVASHAVAVGSQRWPTEKGEWTIKQVVWNPDWIPPDESWAEDNEPKESGAADNPLGRAQLVYDLPRTIHGTNNPSSIGKAVSHGSIRLPNEVIVQLAEQVMDAGGAGKDDAWVRQAQQNRRQKQVVDLPRPVPIRVY
jgi:lipoprotein-anchoring transpeptidase ErfK/SrfK